MSGRDRTSAAGRWAAVATLRFEAVFWIGYALPIPPIGAMLRVLLLAVAWGSLAPRTVGIPQRGTGPPGNRRTARGRSS